MRNDFDFLKFEIRLWAPQFGGYILHIGMASADCSFPMVHVAEAPANVDYHSYFTTTNGQPLMEK